MRWREAAAGEGWCAGSVSHLGIDALLGQPDQHRERLSVEPRLQQLREVVQGCAARRREVSGGGAGGAGCSEGAAGDATPSISPRWVSIAV